MRMTGIKTASVCTGLLALAGTAFGNNIAVSNLSLVSSGTAGTVDVQLTISWDNSWRATWTESADANVTGSALNLENWDAAWVFLKWRSDSEWKPATLSTNEYTAPEGTAITVSPDGVGAFIYRSAAGSGSFSTTVKLRWKRVTDGAGASIDVSAHAIEMVYVPEGAFDAGSGSDTETGSFTDGSWTSGATIPFMISGEDALTITNTAGHLWGRSSSGDSTIGGYGTLPAAFPKGYQAFYCMKYETTQGQYAEFLNTLTAENAAYRYDANNAGSYRYTITGTYPNYAASATNRACNYLSWIDGIRYSAWAGLRPMTELEYEKACRGPLNPVADEYAWGNTSITQTTSLSNDGTPDESPLPAAANCVCNSAPSVGGPIRAGAFATASSGRRDAGASYWGIMELSGNVWERPISVGRAEGRAYTGLHGAGTWDLPAGWPTTEAGYGVRGGAWNSASSLYNHTSDRSYASVNNVNRSWSYGWRGVRTAP